MFFLDKYGVKPFEYSFALCRIEPENNCHVVLEAAAKSGAKLLFVGNWGRSNYGVELRKEFDKYENISLLDPIYDLKQLYVLRSNAARYIHGHSAGGTNPSLVEAMFFGREIFAFDVVYNRETTKNKTLYFSDTESLSALLALPIKENVELQNIAKTLYTWAAIRDKYEDLF